MFSWMRGQAGSVCGLDILQKISKKKLLIILIEDCHWMDKASVAVLEQLLLYLVVDLSRIDLCASLHLRCHDLFD